MTGKRFLHYMFIVGESATVDSPRKGPVMQTFGFFFAIRQTKLLNKHTTISDLRFHDTHVTSLKICATTEIRSNMVKFPR